MRAFYSEARRSFLRRKFDMIWNSLLVAEVCRLKNATGFRKRSEMKRDGHSDRRDPETDASELGDIIEGWLRYELQNLHKSVLDESLPPPLKELLAQLETKVGATTRSKPYRCRAEESRADDPTPTGEED